MSWFGEILDVYSILRQRALSLIPDSSRVLKSDMSLSSFPEREMFGLHPVHVMAKGRYFTLQQFPSTFSTYLA